MPKPPLITRQSATVYETPWFKLERAEVEKTVDGSSFTYTYLSVAPSVMVVAMDGDGRIVIVRQYRYPTRRYSYELPGGGSGVTRRKCRNNCEVATCTLTHIDKTICHNYTHLNNRDGCCCWRMGRRCC